MAGVTVDAVHRARQRGQIEAERTGKRHWYYKPAEVSRWMRERLLRR